MSDDPWIIETEALHHGHRAVLLKPRRTWWRKRLRYSTHTIAHSTFRDSKQSVIARLKSRVPLSTPLEVRYK